MPTDDAFDVGSVENSAHRRLPRLLEASPKLRPPFCALRCRKRGGDAFACYSPGLLMVVFYTFTCCFLLFFSLGRPLLLGFGADFSFGGGGVPVMLSQK